MSPEAPKIHVGPVFDAPSGALRLRLGLVGLTDRLAAHGAIHVVLAPGE